MTKPFKKLKKSEQLSSMYDRADEIVDHIHTMMHNVNERNKVTKIDLSIANRRLALVANKLKMKY